MIEIGDGNVASLCSPRHRHEQQPAANTTRGVVPASAASDELMFGRGRRAVEARVER
jgi:hypothetical protein